MSDSATSAIRQAREAKGLTQEELARQVGVTKAAISKWEVRRAFPRPAQAERLVGALGITFDKLYEAAA